MDEHKELRDHLIYLLGGGGAHRGLSETFEGMPENARGIRPSGLPYSLWELLEHIRISQWDILEFSRDRDHRSPAWPEGYWPSDPAPPSEAAWHESLERTEADLGQMVQLVRDPGTDLFTPFPWGDGQTLLREALLVADHNAYHCGQAITLRRLLGLWPPE